MSNALFDAKRAEMRGMERLGADNESRNSFDVLLLQPGALREIAALVLAARTEQKPDAVQTQPIQLVDRAQHDETTRSVFIAAKAQLPPARRLESCGC